MKSVIFAITFTLAIASNCNSQCKTINLIKNPNLEDYYCCPNNVAMIDCAKYWMQPLITGSTSEYLNTCGIDSLVMPSMLPYFQHTYFGNGYAGILIHDYFPPSASYREYIQGTLSEPLIAGQCYYCEFWVELFTFKNTSPFAAIDAISIFFSDTLPKKTDSDAMAMYFAAQINNPTGRIITDTSNWTKICGTFYATGGENFFNVGTFKQENEINKIYFGTSQINRSYYFFDNFSLCPCEDTIKKAEAEYLEVNPNPNNGNMIVNYNIIGNEIGVFEMFDMLGRMVYTHELNNEETTFSIYGTFLSSGVYYYRAMVGQKKIGKGKVVVIK